MNISTLGSSAVHVAVDTEASQHIETSSKSQSDIYYSGEEDSEVVFPLHLQDVDPAVEVNFLANILLFPRRAPFLKPLGPRPLITEHVSPWAAAAAANQKKKVGDAAAATTEAVADTNAAGAVQGHLWTPRASPSAHGGVHTSLQSMGGTR